MKATNCIYLQYNNILITELSMAQHLKPLVYGLHKCIQWRPLYTHLKSMRRQTTNKQVYLQVLYNMMLTATSGGGGGSYLNYM